MVRKSGNKLSVILDFLHLFSKYQSAIAKVDAKIFVCVCVCSVEI